MATSSFFYGGSSAPEQNTVDELIDALNAAVAAANEDRVDAETAAQQSSDSASNALLAEQNTVALSQQANTLLTAANAASASATSSASLATTKAGEASTYAANALASKESAAVYASAALASELEAEAAVTNPYLVAVGSDLAGSGWTYDFGLVTDAATPLGSGTSPGYIETVAENISSVQDVATNITAVVNATASATAAASSASSAATSATNAATSASSASGSASTATAQASSATSSATSATASATAAASSASSASSSASSAATSATSASGSASTASSAATAAQAAQAAAEAVYDNFDDRYLGSKSSAPTVDNDGNTLVTGTLYFNTTVGQMFVWSGGAWGSFGGGGSGDVIGPTSSTDNAIARFDGTTGKLVQNSSASLDDSGNVVATAYGLTGMNSPSWQKIYNPGGQTVSLKTYAVNMFAVNGQFRSAVVPSDTYYGWTNDNNQGDDGYGAATGVATHDVRLYRDDASGVLAQRNSTNPQTFRLYNTYTDASNYERGFVRWNTNVLEIGAEKAGTGSNRDTKLVGPVYLGNYLYASADVLYLNGFNSASRFNNSGYVTRSSGYYGFDSSDTSVASTDTALARDSAGIVKVTNGSTGLGSLKASTLDVNGSSVTSTKIGNWDTAYGWGNHASAGYLTAVPDSSVTSAKLASILDLGVLP